MAATTISQAVGIRNGKTLLPNRAEDLGKIRDLFDTIPTDAGGTRDSEGFWATQRELLIPQLTGHIVTFQAMHSGLTADGAIDPGGNTLKRMNALSQGGGGGVVVGIRAQAVPVLNPKYPELATQRSRRFSRQLERGDREGHRRRHRLHRCHAASGCLHLRHDLLVELQQRVEAPFAVQRGRGGLDSVCVRPGWSGREATVELAAWQRHRVSR